MRRNAQRVQVEVPNAPRSKCTAFPAVLSETIVSSAVTKHGGSAAAKISIARIPSFLANVVPERVSEPPSRRYTVPHVPALSTMLLFTMWTAVALLGGA